MINPETFMHAPRPDDDWRMADETPAGARRHIRREN